MAQNNSLESMAVAHNSSMECQKTILAQQQQELDTVLLGTELEDHTVDLTAEVERIGKEVNQGVFEVPQYKEFVDIIYKKQTGLLKAFVQWKRAQGTDAEPAVGKRVATLEVAAIELIKLIKSKMGLIALGIGLGSEGLNKPSKAIDEDNYRFPTKRDSGAIEKSKPSVSTKTKTPEFPTTQESETTLKNGPLSSSQHEVVSSAYAGHLAAAKTRKTGSKAGSKASSKG